MFSLIPPYLNLSSGVVYYIDVFEKGYITSPTLTGMTKSQYPTIIEKFLQSNELTLKRPSHDNFLLANMCWPTPKSWPTVAFTRQTHVKSQHTPTRKHGVHGAMAHTESCRFRLAFILCFSSKKQQKAMEKQKGLGKIIHKIIHFNATSSIFFCLFAASLYPLDEISHKSGHD